MLIDIFAALFLGATLDPYTGGYGGTVVLISLALFFIGWLWGVIRLSKKESKTGMWVTLLVGLFLSFLVGWIVSMFMGGEDKKK